ncbi:PREDICTED: dnaJ homolog subfamily B member 12-like [Camelina sativa]|uniref:DnaJ homolog subfamily B member 12-like n=1 Tax=Camelina sativa TaxID=90675 RepID=A0ABM0TUH0_CAMSA|nr:PREDICTED: dnaJ homolog subfamily B member 12-like [Camelina sativa]
MESNKDEARRAIDIAEKKISANDYDGAKKLVNKAQRLYPQLEGLKQVLMTIDVYISASNKTNGESDWYGVLGVDPLADDEAVKKRYKKLALLLHPDKNRFHGAEGAFKLVSQACNLLSDKKHFDAVIAAHLASAAAAGERASKLSENIKSTERLFKRHANFEAERLFKGGNANSTFEAERRFKGGNANSTFEAERLFKRGNANSTFVF